MSKGSTPRFSAIKQAERWPTCVAPRCRRMRAKGSEFCAEHRGLELFEMIKQRYIKEQSK